MLKKLTVPCLKTEATAFAAQESTHAEPSLFGVTDGKAVGTYLEQISRAKISSKPSQKTMITLKDLQPKELIFLS